MTIDWNTITAQGPVFWIACGSVALGVAMIAAAALAQVRRLRAAVPAAEPRETVGKPAAAPVVEADVRPRTIASPGRSPGTDVHRRRLEELLDRLEKVASSLETWEPAPDPAAGREIPTAAPETPLKEGAGGVEYVFRAAGG